MKASTANTPRPKDADPLRAGIEAALRRAARVAKGRAEETRKRETRGKKPRDLQANKVAR